MKSQDTSSIAITFIQSSKSTESRANTEILQQGKFKVYKRRWLMLLLFTVYAAFSLMQWIQYSVIANIVQRYYNISSTWVDWTSMVALIGYVIFIFPATWMLDKWGLRVTVICGAVGSAIGAWVKVFSVDPSLFYLAFIGQTIAGCSQVFVLSPPARLAAVWFGPDQVSSACSIGVFGIELGIDIGFVVPPMIVANHDDIAKIGDDLQFLNYLIAGLSTIILLLVLFFFDREPPTHPSAAVEATANQPSPFIDSVKRLMLSCNFWLHFVTYGIMLGVFNTMSTMLNQIILVYYPGHEQDVGRIGLVLILAGLLGAVCCGIVLDKTHRFKETAITVYSCSMISMWIFTFTLNTGYIEIVYVTSALLGFFMAGYIPVGVEFVAELTYPEPEGTTSGLLIFAGQGLGFGLVLAYGEILNRWNDVTANIIMAVMLCVGSVLTAIIRSDLKRQAAQNVHSLIDIS